MDDLISKTAAIDAVEEIPWYHQNKNGEMVQGANSREHQAWYKADDIYHALYTLPSAQPGWIPVTERLPEESGEYLCTIYRAIPPYHMFHPEDDVYVKTVEVKEYRASGGFPNCVKAWQPKPKPWKGGQDNA